MKTQSKVLSFADATEKKRHLDKEQKVADLAHRFEMALPSKLTPVKDYLKKKANKKKRQ